MEDILLSIASASLVVNFILFKMWFNKSKSIKNWKRRYRKVVEQNNLLLVNNGKIHQEISELAR